MAFPKLTGRFSKNRLFNQIWKFLSLVGLHINLQHKSVEVYKEDANRLKILLLFHLRKVWSDCF